MRDKNNTQPPSAVSQYTGNINTMVSAAATAVLGTTELAELILLCLDFKDLVKARSICQKFYDISGDTKFQKLLFLEPVDVYDFHLKFIRIQTSMPDLYRPFKIYGQPQSRFEPVVITLNPIFAELGSIHDKYVFINNDRQQVLRWDIEFVFSARLLGWARTGSDSGWENMLISQPPVQSVYIGSGTIVENLKGVRFQDIVDRLRRDLFEANGKHFLPYDEDDSEDEDEEGVGDAFLIDSGLRYCQIYFRLQGHVQKTSVVMIEAEARERASKANQPFDEEAFVEEMGSLLY